MRKKRNKSKLTIGFAAIADFRSIIGQDIITGILKASENLNVNLVNFVGPIRYSLKDDIEFFSHYKKKFKYINNENIDGLISWASSFQAIITEQEIEELHSEIGSLPLVTLGMRIGDNPCISLNNRQGIEKAVSHLVDFHNHKNIAFFSCKGRRQYFDRLNIFIETLSKKKLKYDSRYTVVLEELDRRSVKQAILELIEERGVDLKNELDSIICVSDLIARILIEELDLIGIKVPNDIAVIGFNNQIESIRSSPSITTINPHFFNFGYKAVETLVAKINNQSVETSILMPCELIIRQSCGCFEDLIVNAAEIKYNQVSTLKSEQRKVLSVNELYDISERITDIFKTFNQSFTSDNTKELLTCFIDDITGNTNYKFLNAIKKFFFNFKNISEERQIIWQSIISEIRNLILPYLMDNQKYISIAENIFHQTRVMIDVANSYFIFSKRGDVYKLGTLARIAADFSTVADIDKVIDLIKSNINELEIPSIYLYIFDELKGDIGNSSLILAYDYRYEELINTGARLMTFNKGCFDIKRIIGGERKSFVFELLYFKDIYIGFVLFEMGPVNIPLYDIVKTILCPSLYATMLLKEKMDAVKEKEILLKNKTIKEILKKDRKSEVVDSKSLTAYKIIEYLTVHINELTNLEKIANDLHCSKSTLVRKTKTLTGYSIQKLHEMLKIERSKLLLENKNLTIQEVADKVGFQNQYYFSNVFKKHTGISPKGWIELNSK